MKKVMTFLFATAFFLLNNVYAQDCPTLSVSSPSSVKDGESLTFIANVSGGKQGVSVSYNWSVSAGSIESGQGTAVIQVNTKGLAGQSVTATVDLGGYPRDCRTYYSSTSSVDAAAPAAELHSKGDYTTAKLFTDEANKFAGDIMSAYYEPQVPQAVIFLYPGKNATAGAAVKEMAKIMKTALTKYGLPTSRYKISTEGKREQTSYEMWIVPVGVEDPLATPAH